MNTSIDVRMTQKEKEKNSALTSVISTFGNGEKKLDRWSPYADNGGSIVAIGGDGYVLIASDTRLASGFSIYTRDQPKLFKLTDETVLGCTGCWCDILTVSHVNFPLLIIIVTIKVHANHGGPSQDVPIRTQPKAIDGSCITTDNKHVILPSIFPILHLECFGRTRFGWTGGSLFL